MTLTGSISNYLLSFGSLEVQSHVSLLQEAGQHRVIECPNKLSVSQYVNDLVLVILIIFKLFLC